MLKPFVLYPTAMEASSSPFDETDRMVCGVGCAEVAYAITKAIHTYGHRLYILAGIAGSYGTELEIGETVTVLSERLSGHYLTEEKIYPLSFLPDSLPRVTSSTVLSCNNNQVMDQIENMEGAVFAAICNAEGVECCEIRSISNRVGDPKCVWHTEKAVANLNKTLKKFFI